MSPKTIKLSGPNQTLAVEWSDGHQSAYPYQYLRDRCPCATCTGAHGPSKHAAPPGALPLITSKRLRPDRAELVGRYAFQIFWNDGHSSGIYTFDYLRGLCPCAECATGREAMTEENPRK
jgi:DUF971 family protein